MPLTLQQKPSARGAPQLPARSAGRRVQAIICQAGSAPTQSTSAASAALMPAPAPAPLPLPQQPLYAGAQSGEPAAIGAQGVLAPESTAVGNPYAQYDPRMYQGAPMRQEYYGMPPPGYYPPPPPYQAKEEVASSGAPWWIWLGAGVLGGQILAKVQEYMKNPKTPQQMMMEMAMKQMSGAMGGPAAGPGNPFAGAAPGGNPFGAAGNPFAGFPTPPTPPVDVAATTVNMPSTSATAPSSTATASPVSNGTPGGKFNSRLTSEGREMAKEETGKSSYDVVEPVVKEPASAGSQSSSASSSKPKPAFSFADVDVSAGAPGGSGNGAAGGVGEEQGSMMSGMMEQMLRNPEMQKMLYPYLPEPMRNPSSIEWMLNNPEVKKQMEQMFSQQNVMTPQMMDMMKGMDFNQDKVNKQFAELGLKPEDVISKVMANPELAAGFSNPKVQAAIIDISANPMNIVKYQEDPEIMKVLEKVTEIFQPGMKK